MMHWDPFEDMRRIHQEMDSAFGNLHGRNMQLGDSKKGKCPARMPLSGVKETDTEVIATFEIPGATKEDVELNVTEDSIDVKATQKHEKEEKGKESCGYASVSTKSPQKRKRRRRLPKQDLKHLTRKAPKAGSKAPDKEPEELKKQAEDYKDSLQRLQAEFENYRKRADRESASTCKYATADFVKKLLPTLDSFEMALKNPENNEKFVKGVELIYAQLYSLLEDEGMKRIDAKGLELDPYRHEVLMQEKSDKDNVVLEEFQKGYEFKDMIIRHSKVKVGRSDKNESN